jgi:hypothetical protein
LDAEREMRLRFGHIAARPGPLEVPMIATPTPDRRLQTAFGGILRRMRPTYALNLDDLPPFDCLCASTWCFAISC